MPVHAPDPPFDEVAPGPAQTGPRARVARSNLPSGRAVAGGLLVALAILGTFALAGGSSEAPRTSFVVVDADVDPGERLTPATLSLQRIDLPTEVAAGAFTSERSLEGAVALAPLRAGELVQRGAVLPPGSPGEAGSPAEVSFRLARDRAMDGALNRGERVDMVATYGTGDDATTWIVVRDALVTAIANQGDEPLSGADEVTITLGLPSGSDVLAATHAVDVGTVTLVRATRDSSHPSSQGPDHYRGPMS